MRLPLLERLAADEVLVRREIDGEPDPGLEWIDLVVELVAGEDQAGAIAAAKSGNEQAFATAARRAQALIDKAHAAARAYGLQACARW